MTVQPATALLAAEARPLRRVLLWALAHRWTLVVWSGMVSWSAALFVLVRANYRNFQLARYDLGDMVQAVWSTAHGHPLEVTSPWGEEVSRLSLHVDPILVLLTPLWVVLPSPLTLAAVQIVACALGALPVYWLGRRHLSSERAAALMALVYLAYPSVTWTASDAMHPVTLAIPLLLYAIWFLDSDRLWAFGVCAVLAALTGELIGLTIAGLGVWYALARGRRLAGAAIALLAGGWSLIAVTVIVPAFLGSHSIYYDRYASLGGSPSGVLKTSVTHPETIASTLTSLNNVTYWIWLTAPLLGMCFLAPGVAAVGVPQLLINGLADSPTMVQPGVHYVAGVIPFLIAASVLGLGRLARRTREVAATALFFVSGLMLVVVGPFPGSAVHISFSGASNYTTDHVKVLREALDVVPAQAPVTATNAVGARLSARRFVYTIPYVGDAQWAVIDMSNPWIPTVGERSAHVRAFRDRLERNPDWTKVFDRDGVVVLKKREA